MIDEAPAIQTPVRFVSSNKRFLFFVFCSLCRDFKEVHWNERDTITAPVEPKILESYAAFIRKLFPSACADSDFKIESA